MGPVGVQSHENTREVILVAAFKLFAKQGFHATSMRDIAKEAGITAGSIYNHYPEKEAIIKAVILAYHPLIRIAPMLEKVEGKTAEAVILSTARLFAQEIEKNPGITNVFLGEVTEMGGRHMPEMIAEIMPYIQVFIGRVYNTSSKLRLNDPLAFFRAFLAMMIGYAVTTHVTRAMPKISEVKQPIDDHVRIFLYGVLEE